MLSVPQKITAILHEMNVGGMTKAEATVYILEVLDSAEFLNNNQRSAG